MIQTEANIGYTARTPIYIFIERLSKQQDQSASQGLNALNVGKACWSWYLVEEWNSIILRSQE